MLTRAHVRAAAELAMTMSGLERLARLRVRHGKLVLAYHNIVPPGETVAGDGSLHLAVSAFGAQLDALMRTHDILPLQDVLEAPHAARRRPLAAITFDDAYRGAVTCGVTELAKRSLPATIFVAPAYIGGHSFWWDALSPSAVGLTPALRTQALESLGGDDEQIRNWAAQRGLMECPLPEHALCATENELAEACRRYPGLTLGSHTWSHANLPRLTPERVKSELTRPLEWLYNRFNTVIPVLSYPYGSSSPTVEVAAARAGYRAALCVNGGWMTNPTKNRFAIPRLNVPAGVTSRGFELRIAGMLCS